MKLLVRGGSISSGAGVTRSYVDILQEFCSSRGVELINKSRPGENSFDGIPSFYGDIDPFLPDMLMIHFGIDDAFFPVYRSEFKENLVRIVKLARQRFNPIIIIPTSHTFDDQYEMDAVNIYYRTIREVCQDLSCEMISVHTYWAGYCLEHNIKNTELVQKDARYPNERGHEIFAEVIMHHLERIFSMVPSHSPEFSQES
jgi:hypothetical protein